MSSFGETLRRERELRGIDLREVAEATKISVRFLQALENGRLDILPGGIFPRAFVRQYAAYLGLDPERTVAEFMYSSGGGAAAEPVAPAPRVAPVTRTRPVPVGVALGALAVLVVVLLAWRQLRREDTGPEAPVAATTAPPATFPSDRVFPPPTATPPAALAASDELVLDLVARRECWVAVQADGVRVIDRVMAEGETQRLNARREFVLSVGNAGGIGFSINGRSGVALGKDGEVRRNVVITHQSLPSLVEGGAAPAAAVSPAALSRAMPPAGVPSPRRAPSTGQPGAVSPSAPAPPPAATPAPSPSAPPATAPSPDATSPVPVPSTAPSPGSE